eukprot:6460960-Pyramimonas_sp.AAC.1
MLLTRERTEAVPPRALDSTRTPQGSEVKAISSKNQSRGLPMGRPKGTMTYYRHPHADHIKQGCQDGIMPH